MVILAPTWSVSNQALPFSPPKRSSDLHSHLHPLTHHSTSDLHHCSLSPISKPQRPLCYFRPSFTWLRVWSSSQNANLTLKLPCSKHLSTFRTHRVKFKFVQVGSGVPPWAPGASCIWHLWSLKAWEMLLVSSAQGVRAATHPAVPKTAHPMDHPTQTATAEELSPGLLTSSPGS